MKAIFKSVNYWYIFERRAWSAKKGVKEGSGERSPKRGRFGRGDSELGAVHILRNPFLPVSRPPLPSVIKFGIG